MKVPVIEECSTRVTRDAEEWVLRQFQGLDSVFLNLDKQVGRHGSNVVALKENSAVSDGVAVVRKVAVPESCIRKKLVDIVVVFASGSNKCCKEVDGLEIVVLIKGKVGWKMARLKRPVFFYWQVGWPLDSGCDDIGGAALVCGDGGRVYKALSPRLQQAAIQSGSDRRCICEA